MALLIPGIPRTARGVIRSTARAILPWYASMGMNVLQMLASLDSIGLSYGPATMSRDAQVALNAYTHAPQLHRLGLDTLVPKNYMVEDQLRRAYPYMYTVKVGAYDRWSGEDTTLYYSFYSEELMSTQRAGEVFMQEHGWAYEMDQYQFTSLKLETVKHNQGWSY